MRGSLRSLPEPRRDEGATHYTRRTQPVRRLLEMESREDSPRERGAQSRGTAHVRNREDARVGPGAQDRLRSSAIYGSQIHGAKEIVRSEIRRRIIFLHVSRGLSTLP